MTQDQLEQGVSKDHKEFRDQLEALGQKEILAIQDHKGSRVCKVQQDQEDWLEILAIQVQEVFRVRQDRKVQQDLRE